MSSTRGRKKNIDLPPTRSRDTQRTFRLRRAAHMQVDFHCTYPDFIWLILKLGIGNEDL